MRPADSAAEAAGASAVTDRVAVERASEIAQLLESESERGERGRVEQACGVEELDAEGVRDRALEFQQVGRVGAADGGVDAVLDPNGPR